MNSTRITRRHRQVSQHTVIATVVLALIIAIFNLHVRHNDKEQHIESTVALAALPKVQVAKPPPNRPTYKREQYQPHGWIDADGNGCNTRREVLIQESVKKPSINPNGCKISGGKWKDRFDPSFTTTNEQDVQIDHLVALADAHRSGAWNWPQQKKVAFANQLDNPDELNAISNIDNKVKSDKGPDEWMPKDRSAQCTYIQSYVTIKAQWQLSITPEQWDAIAKAWPGCVKTN